MESIQCRHCTQSLTDRRGGQLTPCCLTSALHEDQDGIDGIGGCCRQLATFDANIPPYWRAIEADDGCDRLLDETDESLIQLNWNLVRNRAIAVQALEPDYADAHTQ